MPATAVKTHFVAPEERVNAKGVLDLLARIGSAGALKLVFEPQNGRSSTVSISKSMAEAIRDLAGLIQDGAQVGMFADDPEISPEQAAELLGMSRPTLVQKIRRGELSARMVGAHRRIKMSDLIACQRQEAERDRIEARTGSVGFAVANTVMEGGSVLPETESMLNEWANGEIGDDELIEQTLQRFGPGA